MSQGHRDKMALMTRLKKTHAENTNDITKNLYSLHFESALTEEEKGLLHLRARSHAISVYQCAQAAYFVEILREIRQLRNQIKNPHSTRTTRILQEDSKDPLVIGVLGCGRLGSQIAHCLLTYGKLNPNELHISTRRPETLEYLQQQGVDCYYDNIRLVSSAHLVFICVLPSQLTTVSDEVKDYFPASTIAYIPTSGIPLRRLRQMFGTTNILRPEFSWPTDKHEKPWNYSINVNMALENKEIVEKTCPICDDVSDHVVLVNQKLAEAMVFAVVNFCSEHGLSRNQALWVLHRSMFGENEKNKLTDRITVREFGGSEGGSDECFPQFDLVQVYESESYMTNKLKKSTELRQAFIKRYWRVFEEYLHIRVYGQLM